MKKKAIDFEDDLKEIFGERMVEEDDLCSQIWSSLANVIWKHKSGVEYSCTFRYAGGLIAEIRGEGHYMDWYCSGPYETITDEIKKALAKKGWKPSFYPPNY